MDDIRRTEIIPMMESKVQIFNYSFLKIFLEKNKLVPFCKIMLSR